MRFKKKPVEIEAVQLLPTNLEELCNLIGLDFKERGFKFKYKNIRTGELRVGKPEPHDDWKLALFIPTLEGIMEGIESDWIIKGVIGEFYPCKEDVFYQTYEQVAVINS